MKSNIIFNNIINILKFFYLMILYIINIFNIIELENTMKKNCMKFWKNVYQRII